MLYIIKEEYQMLFSFLKKRKRFWVTLLALSLGVMVVTGVLCCSAFRDDPALANQVGQKIVEIFETKDDLVDDAGNLTALGLFYNNIQATFLLAFVGAVPLLCLSGVLLAMNLLIVGAVCALVISLGVYSVPATLAMVVPHGIFEIPALCLGAGCGLLFCGTLTGIVLHPAGALARVTESCCGMLRTLVLLVTPLLAVAAVIEAYVTPLVFSLFI